MNISKPDFKVIYNFTKNFKNSNHFNQLINDINNNNVQNNNLRSVLNNNNNENVINVINKLNKFSLSINPNLNIYHKNTEVIENKTTFLEDTEATSPGFPDTISNIDSETSLYGGSQITSPGIPDTVSNIDSETSYYDETEATSPGIPDTISDIDNQTSTDEFSSNFIPANKKNYENFDDETSYDVDYKYDFDTDQINNYNSETSDNNLEKNKVETYDNMNEIIDKLLETDENVISPKQIREKYNNHNTEDDNDLLKDNIDRLADRINE